MGEEIVVTVEVPEPSEDAEVIVAEPVIADSGGLSPDLMEELTFLRNFKREDDDKRIQEAEIASEQALDMARLALEQTFTSEEVEEVEEVEMEPIEIVPEEIAPDVEPSNSHPWFKKWFN